MVATLTYNLPEESEEHQTALDGWKWKSSLNELDQLIRSKLKYGHGLDSADKALEFTRQAIHDILSQNTLSF